MSEVQWGDYTNFAAISPIRPEEDTREGAVQQYANWLAQKTDRTREISALLLANEIEAKSDDSSIQDITDWYIRNVEPMNPPEPDMPGALDPRWYSVAIDLGIFLGDVIIERIPSLRWEFFTPTDSSLSGFQKPVIYGFTLGTGKIDPEMAFDLTSSIIQVGHRVVSGLPLLERNRRVMLHAIELAEMYK